MNRSILIVICDFLVLSALSLSSGSMDSSELFQGHSKKGTAKRDLYIEELQQDSIEKRDEIAKLQKELQQTRDERKQFFQSLNQKMVELQTAEQKLAEDSANLEMKTKLLAVQSASLTSKESEIQSLSASLEKEGKRQKQSETALQTLQSDYRQMRAELDSAKSNLEQTAMNLATASALAHESNENLKQTRQELKLKQDQLAEKERILAEKQNLIQKHEVDLARQRDERIQQEKLLNAQKNESKNTIALLKEMEEKLRLAEKRADEFKVRFEMTDKQREKVERNLVVSEDNRIKVEKQLSDAQGQLSGAHDTIATTTQALNETKKRLEETENKLIDNAISNYTKAVSDLHVQIEVPRFPTSLIKDEHYYYPYVKIGGAYFLVSETSSFFEADIKDVSWNKVKNLAFSFSDLVGKGTKMDLKMPFLISHSDPRVVLIPVGPVAGTALTPISFEALKKRGTQNLTLFKASSMDNNYADLEGRCSLSLSGPDKGFLNIRNSTRSSSELKAMPGDFVLSKEGYFVGVVVSVRNSDFGQKQEALCYIFPEKVVPADFYELRITKTGSEESYPEFLDDIKAIQSHLKVLPEK